MTNAVAPHCTIDEPEKGHLPTRQISRAAKAAASALDMERAADALLEAAGAMVRGSGIYTEARLDRRINRERRRLPRIEGHGLPRDVIDSLTERWIDELIDLSGLTLRQEIVFRLHLCGLSVSCIAATLNINRHQVAFRLRRAKRRVRAAYHEGRYAGWYEVYLSEVNRPAYRRRRHR